MEQNANTALLVMDMQASIISRFQNPESVIKNVSKAIAHAHEKNIPVIYVVVGFRKNAPEISADNKIFSAAKASFGSRVPEEMMKIHTDIFPKENDVVVTKRRISAFTGSDLEVVLRAQNIRHLVLSGLSTSGVVLSTTREAADKDFTLTILSDCCGDADEEVHRILTTKIFVRQAEVLTAEEWIKK